MGSMESNPSFMLRALKDVAIESIPNPHIKNPYDVTVRIAQTGICMSDVHYW
jgi:D-xylulose reductase